MTAAHEKVAPSSDAVPHRASKGLSVLPDPRGVGRDNAGGKADRPAAIGQLPLVSVVTPAYNEEIHLRECIESVLAQTYQNWDYTIVNNCSTDRTLEIAREYASKDKRIRVHDNETFAPVITNHNIAFRQISPDSKYCKLVAADDWIYPDCLEKMVRLAEANPTVAIVGAYKIVGEKLEPGGLPFPKAVASGREVCRNYLAAGPYLLAAPTSLLFRADIVRRRHSFFNEPYLHADAEACLEALVDRDFGFVHEVLTFARRRESLSSSARRLNKYLPDRLEFLQKFGSRFFDAQEFEDRIRAYLREYYSYLGTQFGRRREAEFWDFHREELARLRHPLSMTRVFVHGLLYAIEASARRLHRLF